MDLKIVDTREALFGVFDCFWLDSPRFLHKLKQKEIKGERGFGDNFLSTLFTAKVGTFCHCIGGGGIRKGHFEVHINYNLNLSL